jgi:Ca2+-transporting ATPase
MFTTSQWYNLTVVKALEALGTSEQGLSSEEAQKRLSQFGPNELKEKKKTSPGIIFWGQFKSFLIIILIVAAAISGVLAIRGEGNVWDPILIMVIVLFACLLGFIQEYHSERAMEALKQMTAPTASVKRDGQEIEVPSRKLVPGDIILLRAGDRVPADARLVEVANLRLNEAPLTGESIPVEKATEAITGRIPIGDRRNIVYMGTTLVYGRGEAVVIATGMATEFGKIAGMLQQAEAQQTPLQASLDRVGKWLGIGCLVLCAGVAGVGFLSGMFSSILDTFIWGVSLMVAAVPEALPAVVTISLAIGVQRMAKRHSLIRRLPAVETLGCTTFICSDKTGTLTQDEMTVRRLYVNGREIDVHGVGYEPRGEFYLAGTSFDPQKDDGLKILLWTGALCNDSQLINLEGAWHIKGDPTEGALVVAAAKAGIWQGELSAQAPRIGEVPFSSERKRMTTIHHTLVGRIAYSKGAPEVILNSCNRIYMGGRVRELTEWDRERILETNRQMAEDALRVLGMAYKPLPEIVKPASDAEKDMVFIGLVGMIDPPRQEVKEALELCQQARIKSVMITGDHKLTAIAVAKELGLLKEGSLALSGSELDELSEEEFDERVEEIAVYARVSPTHKIKVVEALQKKGHVTAMTGDGINDAPALKRANIGVAMGITGTDVSKEAADMVLTDDNFASIVAAVREGRSIFGNIKKFLAFLLSGNLGAILFLLTAFVIITLTGEHVLPLVALQLLFINLIGDGLLAVALAMEPPDMDIMRQPPRNPKQGVFTTPTVTFIGGVGLWIGLVLLGIFLWALNSDRSALEIQCLCFVTLIMLRMFNCFNCRSERLSLFKISPFTNKWVLAAIVLSLTLTMLLLYVPSLQSPFHTYGLSPADWGMAVLAGSTVFIVVEIAKLITSWHAQRGRI